MEVALAEQYRSPSKLTWSESECVLLRLNERITVSQWAERHRYVTNGPHIGRWNNATTPYLVEPMDTLNLPWVRQIILQFAPQTGKTQVAFNFMCYCIDQEPGPCMYIMPDEKVTKRIARRRIIPMFKGSPRIARLMSDRMGDTSTLAVQFKNGMDLMMAWATSAAEMASESVRYLIRDETDKFPEFSGKEADPRSLSDMRTNAYPYTKKIIDMSTPTDELGLIGRAMENEAEEVRHYYIVCPKCKTAQRMVFSQIWWPEMCSDAREIVRKSLARYECCECKSRLDDYHKNMAVRMGYWKADEYIEKAQVIGFQLPAWYSPFVSLSNVVAAHIRGKDDVGKRYVFVTQYEAEVYREAITPKAEARVLEHKTDIPPLIVPRNAVALTCGIDSQKVGFWYVVRAWDGELTSWLLSYGYLGGWDDVKNLVYNSRYQREGTHEMMEIWRVGIDTGGGESDTEDFSRTEEIYQWLRNQPPIGWDEISKKPIYKVYGIKGASHAQLQAVRLSTIDKLPSTKIPIPGGLELRLINTNALKALIHYRLERGRVYDEKGKLIGWNEESQRFLLHSETGEDYAKQLLAEELRRDKKNKKEWVRVRRANHLLDAEVIAAACADGTWVPSLKMMADYLKGQVSTKKDDAKAVVKPKQTIAKSNWMNKSR